MCFKSDFAILSIAFFRKPVINKVFKYIDNGKIFEISPNNLSKLIKHSDYYYYYYYHIIIIIIIIIVNSVMMIMIIMIMIVIGMIMIITLIVLIMITITTTAIIIKVTIIMLYERVKSKSYLLELIKHIVNLILC